MKILFHSNHLAIRGTEVALYDYACFNQTILGNESAIAYDATSPVNDPLVIEKFAKLFPLYTYENFSEFDLLVRASGCDRAYFQKSGHRDGKVTSLVPSCVHAVFPTPPEEYHGSVFAFISQWLSDTLTQGRVPFVPYMVQLPEVAGDLREALKIPKDAFVFGSYGGSDSFNVPFVGMCIKTALAMRRDIYFLFMNYPREIAHERVIYLDRSADLDFKTRFINTADAMLHARELGESFGLACAEFSIRNKPIITWGASPQRCHLGILGDKALVYNEPRQLFDILAGIDKHFVARRNWDCYSEQFSPRPVMEKFKQVFLDPAV